MHFYLPIEEGRKLYAKLRNLLPGWAVPQYVVDIPGGGKTSAYNPEKYEFSGKLISREKRKLFDRMNYTVYKSLLPVKRV